MLFLMRLRVPLRILLHRAAPVLPQFARSCWRFREFRVLCAALALATSQIDSTIVQAAPNVDPLLSLFSAREQSPSRISLAEGNGVSDVTGFNDEQSLSSNLNAVTQFLTYDGGSGPTRTLWSRHLRLRWKNRMGDYVDAEGTPQGKVPFSRLIVAGTGWASVDVTELARRDEGKGFYLSTRKNTGLPRFLGRLSAHPPELIVNGRKVSLLATAGYYKSSYKAYDTTDHFDVSPEARGILQFAIPEKVDSAELRLYVSKKKSSGKGRIELFRLDPPAFVVDSDSPRQGSGKGVVKRVDWSKLKLPKGAKVLENGRTLRHKFVPKTGDSDTRLSLSVKHKLMRADLDDAMRPPNVVEDEIYVRMQVFLEDDWTSTRDGNKGGIGWDLRMGWWNDAGYWQSTGGNGGKPGTGLKKFAEARSLGKRQRRDLWEYEGHSIRMEFGKGQKDDNPYNHLRPLQSYVYHLDQKGPYGDMVRLGNAVVQRGKWFSVEQRLKMNSITGPYDELGNGQAVPDGILETWLNGELVHSRQNFRWRRHPEMGIEGIWQNWYYGGKRATEVLMHYRVRDVVIGREYIGPGNFE